jgi:tRNA-splicing ligase RtcB (3'-phosphate/5'-hydroxy nucleic acid ligase)
MAALRFGITAADLPDNLGSVRDAIEAAVPVGFSSHPTAVKGAMAFPLWSEFDTLTEKVHGLESRARLQCGTLGGGNHFIELCLDQDDRIWLMLHSGSRNIGKVLAEYHIGIARKLAHNSDLPDRDLAVFLAGTPEFAAYRHDLMWVFCCRPV